MRKRLTESVKKIEIIEAESRKSVEEYYAEAEGKSKNIVPGYGYV
jgi:hypothetical protein